MLFEIYLNSKHTFNICLYPDNKDDLHDHLTKMAFLGQDVLIKDVHCNMWYRWNGSVLSRAKPFFAQKGLIPASYISS